MQVKTFTVINEFNQKERREARVVKSLRDIPVGFGKVGSVSGFDIWATNLLFSKEYYAIKK